jgi:hypothetical protein
VKDTPKGADPEVGATVADAESRFTVVSVNDVARVTPPPTPLAVIVYAPGATDKPAMIVSVVLQGEEQLAGENDAFAPVGNRMAENEIGWLAPDMSLAVIAVVALVPWLMMTLPLFAIAKSNGAVTATACEADAERDAESVIVRVTV